MACMTTEPNVQCVSVLSRKQNGWTMVLTTQYLLVLRLRAGGAIALLPSMPVNFHVTQQHRAVYKNFKHRKLATSLSRINYLSVWCLLF
jgi:hypothetical protein